MLLSQTYTLRIAVAVLLFLGSAAHSPAQLPTSAPPPKSEPTARTDSLGRETPRSTLIGFLKYEQSWGLRNSRSLPATPSGASQEFGPVRQGVPGATPGLQRQHQLVER
jgi:hypothetical protein